VLDDGYGGHIVNAVAEDQTENFPAVRRAKNEASGEEGGRRTSALVAGHEFFHVRWGTITARYQNSVFSIDDWREVVPCLGR